MPNGFTTNAHRYDPYKTFKFVVSWEGEEVMGVQRVGPLTRTTQVVTHRSGGDPSHVTKSPGQTEYSSVRLERGITHDARFREWAEQVHSADGDDVMDLVNYKKPMEITMRNERGQPVHRYFLSGCWVSEITVLPQLDATTNEVAIESIEIQVETFTKDAGLPELPESG